MGLFENIRSEKVSNLNLRKAILVEPEQTLRDVVSLLREQNLGCAILVDKDRKPVGMFTESMLTQIVSSNPAGLDDPVNEHAAFQCPQVYLDDPVSAVLDALEVKNTRFLTVVDHDGQVVGLTGQKGLMEFVADHFPQVTVQRVGQSPSMKSREGA